MKQLTLHERVLIVAVVALLLIGSIVRYSRALRDRPDPPTGVSTAIETVSDHVKGTRTN